MADKHSQIYEKIKALKEARTAEMGDVTELITKKQALKTEIMALQEERNAIWNDKKEKMRLWNEWDKAQRVQRQMEIKAKWEAERAERAAKDAAWELEKPNPYLSETTLLEQTIDYCKQLIAGKEEVAEEKVNPADWKAPVEGAVVVMAKKDRDTEFYFAPTKGKKGPKAKAPKESEQHQMVAPWRMSRLASSGTLSQP